MGSSFGFTIPFTVVQRTGSKKLANPVPSSFHRLSLPSFTQDSKRRGGFIIPSLSARMLPGWNASSHGPDDPLDCDGQQFSSNTSLEGPALTLEIGLTPSRSRASENSLSAIDLVPSDVGVIVNGSSLAQCGSSSFTQFPYAFAPDRRSSQSDRLHAMKGDSACGEHLLGGNASAGIASHFRSIGGASSHSHCDARSTVTNRNSSTPNSRINSPVIDVPGPSTLDKGPSPPDKGSSLLDKGSSPLEKGPSPLDKGPTPQDKGLKFLLVDGKHITYDCLDSSSNIAL